MHKPDPEHNDHLARVQQRWSQRTASRASLPTRPVVRMLPITWIAGILIAATLMLGWLWFSQDDQQAAVSQPPSQVRTAAAPRTAVAASDEATLPVAIVAYAAPTRAKSCSALGAVEPGRSFIPREQRGAWIRLELEGSGAVWTNASFPANTFLGVRATLQAAIVAYAAPGATAQGCAGIIGAVEPGRPYKLLEQRTGWSRLQVEGSGEIWSDSIEALGP